MNAPIFNSKSIACEPQSFVESVLGAFFVDWKKTNVENEQETSRKKRCWNLFKHTREEKMPDSCLRSAALEIDVDTIWLRSYYTERVDLSLKWDTYGGGKLSGSACQGLLNYPEPISTLVKELPSLLYQDDAY